LGSLNFRFQLGIAQWRTVQCSQTVGGCEEGLNLLPLIEFALDQPRNRFGSKQPLGFGPLCDSIRESQR